VTECRHGFDEELCDICSPRRTAEPVRTAPTPRRPAVSKARERVAPTSLRSPQAAAAAPVAESRASTPFAQRRIYHVTHIDNLAGILADGALRAGAIPDVDLLAPEERAAVVERELVPGAPLSGFVPFSISPDAAWWNALRALEAGERYSRAARKAATADFIVFIGTTAAAGPQIVVTDGPGGEPGTSFAVGGDAAGPLLRRSHLRDPELRQAEAYVAGSYSVGDLAMLATANEPIRAEVKRLVGLAGVRMPRLGVFPPLFQPTVDDEL